jgi:murein DD-endopeptidase MepM/ murein hydrolase activator NlpD/plasmid maintenance system antidote protein VapI
MTPVRRTRLLALIAALAVAGSVAPALAQEPDPSTTSTTTSTTAPPITVLPPGPTTTTEPPPPPPEDPGGDEELPAEPVPVVPDTVPPRPPDPGVYAAEAGEVIRRQLTVAEAEAVELESAYETAKQRLVSLEAELDLLEVAVTSLAAGDRAAVRRVEAARRHFEARAALATVRGRVDNMAGLVNTDDPNELAVAQSLLASVLNADQAAVEEYLAAKADVDAELVGTAERLVDARLELEGAREALVDARRANVAAQFNLAVFAAGSEIVIRGFVFPVGDPHSFGDSFGAPRMMGTGYEHAHQGTDILAPSGTPLLACERGIITRMGSDVLGGTKIWVKGESGTYYYYAHLSAFEEGMADGLVVEAGDIIGYVGDTGNARGGPPHLHFEIHPDGGPAVNPYPLLKVVDELSRRAQQRAAAA